MVKSQLYTSVVFHEGSIPYVELRYDLLVIREKLEYILPRDVDVVEYFIWRPTN